MSIATAKSSDEVTHLRAALKDRDSRIRELELLVDFLRKKPYRSSSEQYQFLVSLFDEAETADIDAATPKPAEDPKSRVDGYERNAPKRTPLPEALPREIIRHDLPEDQRSCSCCGDSLHEIGVDATEQLDIIPAKIQVLRHERVKYGCRTCEAKIVTATMPPQPIPKSMASPSTLAHVAISKYADHLPLYRQEAMWSRSGIDLDRGTLASWMIRAGDLVQPLVNLLLEDIKESEVVGCDETTVQVLKEKDKKPTAPGYVWVLSRAGPGRRGIIFEYDPSRSGRVAQRLLVDFKGVVVTDGFDGYRKLVDFGIKRAGCWAHVRRKFVEALEIEGKSGRSTVAAQAIALIGKLYDIERRAKELDANARLHLRVAESALIISDIDAMLSAEMVRVAPKSPTGRALSYLRGQWPGLQIFLKDGRVPIDNNAVENAIRPFTLGRKNWLFSATPAGARASANLYSLIETAKANGIDPHAYLAKVFTELPKATTVDEIASLLPYPTLN